jgi:hypothetical protein
MVLILSHLFSKCESHKSVISSFKIEVEIKEVKVTILFRFDDHICQWCPLIYLEKCVYFEHMPNLIATRVFFFGEGTV